MQVEAERLRAGHGIAKLRRTARSLYSERKDLFKPHATLAKDEKKQKIRENPENQKNYRLVSVETETRKVLAKLKPKLWFRSFISKNRMINQTS